MRVNAFPGKLFVLLLVKLLLLIGKFLIARGGLHVL